MSEEDTPTEDNKIHEDAHEAYVEGEEEEEGEEE